MIQIISWRTIQKENTKPSLWYRQRILIARSILIAEILAMVTGLSALLILQTYLFFPFLMGAIYILWIASAINRYLRRKDK